MQHSFHVVIRVGTEYNFILLCLVTLNLTRIFTISDLYMKVIPEFIFQYISVTQEMMLTVRYF